jgi:hypothetical protein
MTSLGKLRLVVCGICGELASNGFWRAEYNGA